MRRRSFLTMASFLGTPAVAQPSVWRPAAPVRYVVPFPPGSAIDLVGRLTAETAGPLLGQNFIVENRPGAGTLLAVQAVKLLPPDGQTLLMIANSFTVNQTLHRPQPYNASVDFDPLALLVGTPHVLVCHPSVASDFTAFLTKANQPGAGLSFGSNGQGTSQHMGLEHLKLLTGLNAEHVPYRGVAPMLTDLYSGRVHYTFGNLPDVLEAVHAGRLVALGIVAQQRHRLLSNLPTMAELGLPQLVNDTFYGVVMPAGAQPDIKAALSSALLESIGRPAAQERMEAIGLDVVAHGSSELAARILRDTAIYAEVIHQANLTPN